MPVSKEQWDLMFAERCASQPHLHPAEIADSLCAFEASVGEAERAEDDGLVWAGGEWVKAICLHCGGNLAPHPGQVRCESHGEWVQCFAPRRWEEVAWITGGTERDPDLCVHCGLRDGCHYCDCPVHGAWTLNPQS